MGLIVNGKPQDKELLDFHGSSIFTTLRSQNNTLSLWPLHWERLLAHARFFDYQLPSHDEVTGLLEELIKTGPDQKIRVIIFAHSYAITYEPYLPPPSTIYRGVDTIISSLLVHPQLASYKTGNSLPYLLAKKEADQHSAFEALLCNAEGYIVDGSRTSLMMFDGLSMTFMKGGLAGCMRAHLRRYLHEEKIPCEEKYLRPEDIQGQVLLCNSLMGVVPVGPVRFDVVNHIINKFRMDQNLESA